MENYKSQITNYILDNKELASNNQNACVASDNNKSIKTGINNDNNNAVEPNINNDKNNSVESRINDKNNKQLLGLELEHFIVDKYGHSVTFFNTPNKAGIETILKDLKPFYSKAKYSSDNKCYTFIIGLSKKDINLSLEPGGQIEVAISAQSSIKKIDELYSNFLKELNSVLQKYDYNICTFGCRPDLCALEVPIIPNNRYVAMDSRFKTIGTHGPCMMRSTCSTQISIDFLSEADCAKKLKLATILAPLFYFLYDNSPIFEKSLVNDVSVADAPVNNDEKSNFKKNLQHSLGKNCTVSGLNIPKRMARYQVWHNTDADRCGSLKLIFNKDFSVAKYVEEVCKLPLIFARGYMKNLNNSDLSTNIGKDLFYGPYSSDEIINNNANLSEDEIIQVLTMTFFDARLKKVIEIRGADSMPKDYAMSYLTLVKLCFYNGDALNNLCKLFKDATYEDYISAGKALYNHGWDAEIYGHKASTLFDNLLEIVKSCSQKKELDYLKPTIDLIKTRQTLCQYQINKGSLFTQYICDSVTSSKNNEFSCVESNPSSKESDSSSLESNINTQTKQPFNINSYLDGLANGQQFMPISSTVSNTKSQKNYLLDSKNSTQDLQKQIALHKDSKAIYEDKIVNMGYFAKIYDKYNVLQFSDIVSTTHKILSKVISAYYKDENLKSMFALNDFCKKLIDKHPGYSELLPMARFDIFFDETTGRFSFCEFNTGGSAAMSEQYYMAKEVVKTPAFKDTKEKLRLSNISICEWELFDSWVDKFIEIYKNWFNNNKNCFNKAKYQDLSKNENTNIYVAIVDFLDNCQIEDFKIFEDSFIDAGMDAEICDIRKLKYDKDSNTLISAQGKKIDVVYKRVTYNDLYNQKEDCGVNAFLQAVMQDAVCSIDWFSTQIVHDKSICIVLHDERVQKLFSKSELDFINLHVPFTAYLDKHILGIKKIIDDKDLYIIKPRDGRGSSSIYEGRDYDTEKWKDIVDSCISNGNYIVQRFCEQYYSPNICIDAYKNYDDVEDVNKMLSQCNNMPGLYSYKGKFSGVYLRQMDKNIIKDKYKKNFTTCCFYES